MVLRPFSSISVISRQWKGEHERLCAMKRRLGSGRISPQNMKRIGLMASEEMSFENVDGWTMDACIYYMLTYEPSAQVS